MAVTTETTVIRIQEQPAQDSQHNAQVIFGHGVQYGIQIRDPFANNEQQEKDLEWYFEEYYTFPYTSKVRAQRAAESIRSYGEALFSQVFADARALDQYRQATRSGLNTLRIEIAGSPTFHRLHWEALYDPMLKTPLSLRAPMIRQNLEPQDYQANMHPSPTINVLVVVARPCGAYDVGYRTISRPLMDELQKTRQPVEVTLLRPGTYMALKTHLEKVSREHGAGYYHVIHFDVHGGLLSYEDFQHKIRPNQYAYQGRPGRSDLSPYEGQKAFLSLESEHEQHADLVEASEVADLLRLRQIPIAIGWSGQDYIVAPSGMVVAAHRSGAAGLLLWL